MAGQRIIIALDGADVRMTTLIDKLESVKGALEFAEEHAAVGGKRTPIYYRLVDLHHSAPTFAFEPVWTGDPGHDRTNAGVYEFRTRIAQIQTGSVPDDIPAEELEAYREIAPYPEESLDRVIVTFDAPTIIVGVQEFEVTRTFHEQIDILLGPEEISWGTMTGMLEALYFHERNLFRLYPSIGPESVKCSFDRSLRPRVKEAVDHYVQVYGQIHYRRRYQFPETITGVYRIDFLDDDPQRPRLSGLRG